MKKFHKLKLQPTLVWMLTVWMLIRGPPDFLILPLAGRSAVRNRRCEPKPEVQGLWTVNVKKSKD
jgi:hypothetical protein